MSIEREQAAKRRASGRAAVFLTALAACGRSADEPAGAAGGRPDFAPDLLAAELTQPAVRPGDAFAYTLRFAAGAYAADRDYTAFLHFEPEASEGCARIAFQGDHELRLPTTRWAPGSEIADGPRTLLVPPETPEGVYRIHAGLFDRSGDGTRVLDASPATVRVARDAPPSSAWQPAPLAQEEVERRRLALRARLREPVVLATDAWSFALDAKGGAFLLYDERSGVFWSSNPNEDGMGAVNLVAGDRHLELPVSGFDSVRRRGDRLEARAELVGDGGSARASVALTFEPVAGGAGLRMTCDAGADPPWRVDYVLLLDHAFATSDADDGYSILPRHLGQLLRTDQGLPEDRYYKTHDDTSMAMTGAVKRGSALLVAWPDSEVVLRTHATIEDSPLVGGRRTRSVSIELHGGARDVEVYPLGPGDYGDVARAYRGVAERRGWRETWSQKLERCGALELASGAAVFRFTALERIAPGTERNPREKEVVAMDYAFDEVARCADHWREDLGIDRAHVLLAGWNRRGYDNEHPDVLPANSECGGDEELADCSRRVKALGFLFDLHDNYQDAYRAAPSFDEDDLARDAGGKLRTGGAWSGGQSYRLCSSLQPLFARRNFPAIAARFDPNAFFLDTTLTTRLETCSDPAHPMSREDDKRARTELCALARERFGVLGVEGGREWAVPLVHWFEGLLTHKTLHRPGWIVVPVFPMAYGDCVGLTGIQVDRVGVADARKVLDHLLYGEMPTYGFGPHLYFADTLERFVPAHPSIGRFEPLSDSRFRISYQWQASGPVERDYDVFVHFTNPYAPGPEGTVFQDDHTPPRPTSTWLPGEVVESELREVKIPYGLEDSGPWEVRIGLATAGRRVALEGSADGEDRTTIARLERVDGRLELHPVPTVDPGACFARGDGGWAAALGPTDRMIKNTYEALSFTNRLVIGRIMTAHRFLTPDRSVEQSEFDDVRITVNYGDAPFELGGAVLPLFGFLVESPTFLAFHATRFGDLDYPAGALFTVRSLDEEPFARSKRIRVFHGFGPPTIRIRSDVVTVEREAEIVLD